MSEYLVCTTSDVLPGEVERFTVEDDALKRTQGGIAVVHAKNDAWYALEDRCSHGRFKMSEGIVEGDQIECSRHGSLFDLSTGEALNPPASSPVRVFPVRVAGDSVYVDV
ncbi:MAG: non-heme iron oxygenase ferredoxin subunit [Actinomycetaceae bacterium]|nr:non-heme iron oxygenase ferredoxin subunit [Arcanobacterium sp.]MDD7504412.1 non-heme iron oxygenase ferredoxin subunit [Actinomycetaceae bacterium]